MRSDYEIDELGKQSEPWQWFLAMITDQEAAGVFMSPAQALKPRLDQFHPHDFMSNADSTIQGTCGTTGMTSLVLHRVVHPWSTASL